MHSLTTSACAALLVSACAPIGNLNPTYDGTVDRAVLATRAEAPGKFVATATSESFGPDATTRLEASFVYEALSADAACRNANPVNLSLVRLGGEGVWQEGARVELRVNGAELAHGAASYEQLGVKLGIEETLFWEAVDVDALRGFFGADDAVLVVAGVPHALTTASRGVGAQLIARHDGCAR